MVRKPKINPVEFLVERKFPNAHELRRPPQVSGSSVGNITKKEKGEIQKYMKELQALPPDKLLTLYDTEHKKYQQERAVRAEKEEQQRFFNLPSADADFDHWIKAAYWSLDEAIALSLGKEPGLVNWESIKNIKSFPCSPFIEKYRKVRELAHRAKSVNQIYDPCTPSSFLSWAQETRIYVHPELLERMKTQGSGITNWKHLYSKQNEQYQSLERAYTSIVNELEQLKNTKTNQSTVTSSQSWQKLQELAEKAIEQYPNWKQDQIKVQRTGNLHDWLLKNIGANTREAEFIKKILSDIYE
jgi:hypothetical protein